MRKLGEALFFLIFMLMGCTGLYVSGSTTLACERVESTQVNCNITEYYWMGLGSTETILPQVEKAIAESYACEKQRGGTSLICYRLVIETKNDKVSTQFLSKDLAISLNDFLGSGQPTFTYQESDWLTGIIFIGLGGLLAFVFANGMNRTILTITKLCQSISPITLKIN